MRHPVFMGKADIDFGFVKILKASANLDGKIRGVRTQKSAGNPALFI